MRLVFRLAFAAALMIAPQAIAPQAGAAEPVTLAPAQVMIVGVFHMSNPGRDLHNVQVPDVLEAKPQGEIAAVAGALARFRPTKVGVEWPEDIVAERYKAYQAGTLAPSRNEVVQLGFRLAKDAHAEGVYSLDADGDFPYERLKNFAAGQGFQPLLDQLSAQTQVQVDLQSRMLSEKGIAATLRYLNEPAQIQAGHAFYRSLLRIGKDSDQPGVDLVTAWYRRNFLICANLLALAKPGDRIVVFFGAGHAQLLRQCVTETPGLKLVEPNDYLPR
ncbi:MAG: hypothetical protein JSR98_20385 [Proteobacteria bacterium]|nr:hypothetical protein [Pseudomonadota bacterium]